MAVGPGENDSERSSHAADTPTSVWDAEQLRAAGIEDATTTEPAPATAPTADTTGRSTIELEPGLSTGLPGETYEYSSRSQLPSTTPPKSQPSGGLSWTVTVILALALGAAVYFLVRYLR